MDQQTLLRLSVVLIVGAAAQWLAWALGLPSILVLLLAGFLAGPVLGVIRPDEIFGNILLPFVSISVAMILFEGGLTLRLSEIRGTGRIVSRLVTIGALVTWALVSLAAVGLLGLDLRLAVLIGAVLTVTGPTVVLPMLRHIKPSGAVGSILKWEGIVIDPIGAMLAVLAFETILTGRFEHAARHILLGLAKTIVVGGGLGALGAVLLVVALRRFWIPDHLRAMVATMFVLSAFEASNLIQGESGLLAVTTMGVLLANQRYADMRHILEFKENLRVFLLSIVFVLLSARVRIEDMRLIGPPAIALVGVVIFVARPAAVFVSTVGSSITLRERLFIAAMAPRGIVAAAVASVFALELEAAGYASARLLVPIVFVTIVGTVLVYGLFGGAVARALELSDPSPQGLLLVGGDRIGLQIANVLQSSGVRVLIADTNRSAVAASQTFGVSASHADVLAEDAVEKLDLYGIGRMLALTRNNEVNMLAAQRFARVFGGSSVFRLAAERLPGMKSQPETSSEGRILFGPEATFRAIESLLDDGAVVKATRLTEVFDFNAYRNQYGESILLLFIISDFGRLAIVTSDAKIVPKRGDLIVALVMPQSAR